MLLPCQVTEHVATLIHIRRVLPPPLMAIDLIPLASLAVTEMLPLPFPLILVPFAGDTIA